MKQPVAAPAGDGGARSDHQPRYTRAHETGLAPGPPDRLDLPLVRLAIVLLLGAIIALLDTTVVNVAIESLAVEFDVSLATIQWVSTGYLIAVAIAIPVAGWAIDRFGGKRVWLAALGSFLLGSLLAGSAWNAESLIAFRVFQGLGGGMIEPVVMAMVARAAGPNRIDRAMSLILVPINLGPILGPVIGGLIVDRVDWRWIFLVNLPIGLITLALGLRYVPNDVPATATRERFDLTGVLLLSPGFATLIYALTAAGDGNGPGSAAVIASGSLGIGLLALYTVHALRMRGTPLLDVRLLANRQFSLAIVVMALIGVVGFSTLFLLPLYFQQVHNETGLRSGLLLTPMGIGISIGMVTVSMITRRLTMRSIVVPGAVLMLMSSIGLSLVSSGIGYGWIAGITLVRGLAIGLVAGPTIASVYRVVRPELATRASSALFILLQVGASLGVAIGAVVVQARIDHLGAHQMPASQLSRDPALVRGVTGAFGEIFWGHAVVGIVMLAALWALTSQPSPSAARAIPAEPAADPQFAPCDT